MYPARRESVNWSAFSMGDREPGRDPEGNSGGWPGPGVVRSENELAPSPGEAMGDRESDRDPGEYCGGWSRHGVMGFEDEMVPSPEERENPNRSIEENASAPPTQDEPPVLDEPHKQDDIHRQDEPHDETTIGLAPSTPPEPPRKELATITETMPPSQTGSQNPSPKATTNVVCSTAEVPEEPTQITSTEGLQRIITLDNFRVVSLSIEDEEFFRDFPQDRRKKIERKIDLRLMPALCFLYLAAQVDRANIANAEVEGMAEDLRLTGNQYNILLASFFILYVILEVPSNIFLKHLKRPSIYLGSLVLAWGFVMCSHGAVSDFKSMLAVRFLLGVFESGMYPAATFLCAQWYHPHSLSFRLSLFMVVAALAGTTSGLLAAAIAKMDGLGGLAGWRWIFIMEGMVTVLMGIATFYILADSPERSKWLDDEEKRFLRIQAWLKDGRDPAEVGRVPNMWKKDLTGVLTDWRCWTFGLILHTGGAVAYGLKFSLPVIIRGMGFSRSKSQLLSAVPYIFGVLSTTAVAVFSDRMTRRGPFLLGAFCIIIGYSIVVATMAISGTSHAISFVGLTLAVMGTLPMAPMIGSWLANNTASSGRRAIALAFTMALGGVGGYTGSFMYFEDEEPTFPTGFRLALSLAIFALLLTIFMAWSFRRQNAIRARMSEEEVRASYTEEQLKEMGEKSPLFRYTL